MLCTITFTWLIESLQSLLPGDQIFTEANGRSVQGSFGNDGLRDFLVTIGHLIFPQDNRDYYYSYRDR